MNNTVCVYWIRHQDHIDLFSQGYIGISNDFEARLRNHKSKPTNIHMKNVIAKYGWDNLIKEQILIASQDYCLMIEKQLRPNDFIGWNQISGGGMPPRPKKGMGKGRKLSEETKRKIGLGGKGKVFSPEAKEKIRQAALKQWARQKQQPEPAEEV